MKARLYITITVFLMFCIAGVGFAQEWIPADVGSKTWNISFNFRDVCFAKIDPSKGWAVGDDGTILHTDDGGATWTEQDSMIKNDLYGVFFLDANTGWAVGEGNTIIRTTNGSDWDIVMSNPQGVILRAIYFTDSSHGWVVGDKKTILYWNGSGWSTRNWDTVQSPNLYGIQFINADTGWAVGDNGTLISTNNGGLNWDMLPTQTSLRLNNISFINADTGWVVGDGGIILYKSKNSITKQGGGGLATLYDVNFINSTEGWICGSTGLTNILLSTTDGGGYWKADTVPFANSTLYAMNFMSKDSGIVVGTGGSIVRYTSNVPKLEFHLTEPFGDLNTLTPTFKWTTNRRNMAHLIYISRDNNPFKNPVYQPISVLNDMSYTLRKEFALSPGDYYWGIKVGDVESREVLHFTVWSPTDIAMISPSGFTKDGKPTFEWHWMENADYTLYVDTDPNPFDGKSLNVGKTMSYKISASDPWNDLPEGVYYWGLASNDNGQMTKSATILKFTVDLTPPKGTIDINDGSRATNSVIVNLKLTASDLVANGSANGSGVVQMQLSNDGTIWTDPESFKPDTMTKAWDLSTYGGSGNDALKTVYVRYKDALDHWSDPIKAEIFVDRTPPTTGTIKINNGEEVTGKYEVILTLSATDVGSGMEPGGIMILSNDGNTWSDPLPYSTTRSWDLRYIGGSEFDGTRTVFVKYKDPAGNWMATPATATIKLDTAGPKGTIAINDGATETISLLVKLTLSATDESGVKEMQFSNGNNVWSNAEPYKTSIENWDLSKFGGNSTGAATKKVYVRFIDNLGNETQPSVESSISYKSEVIISSLTISAPKVTGKVKDGDTVQVSGKSEKDVEIVTRELLDENNNKVDINLSEIVCEKDTGLINGSFTLGKLSVKSIRLRLVLKYKLGNQSEKTSDPLTVDNDPPSNMSVSLDKQEITNSKNLTISISATDAKEMYADGDIGTVYDVENGLRNWIAFRNVLKIKVTDTDGTKVVKVKFRDDMGNESTESSASVILDATAPNGTILINNGDEITGSRIVTLKLSATDANGVASYQLSNDGNTWSEPSAYPKDSQTYEVTNWDLKLYGGTSDDGLRLVYVRYKDIPGNLSSPISDNINTDATPPSISVQLVGNNSEAMKPVAVTAIIKDNKKVTEAYLYYRKKGANEYTKVPMKSLSGDYYTAEIPSTIVTQTGVDYYLSASDGLSSSTHPYKDAPINPNSFTVVDTTPPEIIHDLIAEISVKTSPKIMAKITDIVGIDRVYLYYKLRSDTKYIRVDMTTESGSTSTSGTYTESIPALDLPDVMNYYIEAYDTSSNFRTSPMSGSRQPYELSFVDYEAPAISHTPIMDGQEAGQPVTIGAAITDNVGVENVTFKYRLPGKIEFIEVKMTKVGSYYSVDILGNVLMPGKVDYVITASDVSKQSPDTTVSYAFTVVDTIPPKIELTSASSREEVNKDISIQVKVTDNVKVDSVIMYYKSITDTKFNSVNMKSTGNLYSANIPGQKQIGEVKYYIWASDSQGLFATEPPVDPANAPRVIVIFDSSAPLIQHAPIATAQEAGLPVIINATVTDDVQVTDVSIHYRPAGQESFKIAPMIETATKSLYTGTIPASQVIPTGVEYYINAMDNSGNVTTHPAVNPDKLPHSFRVVDTVPPEITYDPSKLTKVLITDLIVITTDVTDRTGINEVKVYYKLEGDKDFGFVICKDLGNNRYSVTIPSPLMKSNAYYYIQATDNSGNTITSPKQDPTKQPYFVLVDDPFPPLPPTRLSAIPAPGGKVKLTWELSKSTDVGKYNIYTDSVSGTIDYSKVYDSVDASKNSWESTSLGEGIYKFSVRAIDKSGNEEDNTVVVSVEADSIKPDKPTDVTAKNLSGGRIELTWLLSLSRDATVYNIYWDNAQASIDFSSPLARINDPGTKWTSDKLRDGIVYRFVVRCQDKSGNEEENTNIVSARADATPPSVVTRLSSTTHKLDVWSSLTKITVNWSSSEDVISGLAGYSIVWDSDPKTLPDETVDIKDPTTTELTYEPTDLQKQGYAKVYFHIRPVDKAGNWSSDASHIGAFLIDNQAPQSITNLESLPQPGGKIKVRWTASESDDVVKYNIYWDNGKGSGVDYSKTIVTITADKSATYEWISSALTDSQSYEFSVRATDHASNEEKNTRTSASIADDQPPTITHKPISALLEQEIMSVDINAIVDDAGGLDKVKLYYRKHGESKYLDKDMAKEPANVYRGEIPSTVFSSAGVDYYISATDTAGNIATYPVSTIAIVRSLLVPIDPTKETEILLGDGSSIYFPAGAVSSGTNVSITIPSIIPEPQAGLRKYIIAREFSLDKDLLKPITITLKYNDSKIVGEDESKLAMYLWDGKRWNYLAGVNANSNSVIVSTMKTGIFSIIGDYEAPTIKNLLPIGYAEPDDLITATLDDNGSGIDVKKIEVTLNGEKLETGTALKDNKLSIIPPSKFTLGHYSIQVSVKDMVGNQATVTSNFDVTEKLTLINVYCYPNPFDPKIGANFAYTLTESADSVTIRIFGMDGRLVKKLEGTTAIGQNTLQWDCTDEAGEQVLSSVYIAHIEAKGSRTVFTQTIKIAGW